MKLLVTGGGGMLARAVSRVGAEGGDEVISLDRAALDVMDGAAVASRLEAERPDAVIHCAGFTAVDRAESEPDVALAVNRDGTRVVARACQKIGSVFVYPSTDYVFDGEGSRPYRPTDPPNPVNAYGRSKWRGEQAAMEAGRWLVVRTSWLYGAGGSNFVDTIRRVATERETLEVVDDQVGRPTWTVTLAGTIRKLLKSGLTGTFHVSDGGQPVSWAGFAREIVSRTSAPAGVREISSASLARPALRPRYSVLELAETERAIGCPMADWRDSLARYLKERVP